MFATLLSFKLQIMSAKMFGLSALLNRWSVSLRWKRHRVRFYFFEVLGPTQFFGSIHPAFDSQERNSMLMRLKDQKTSAFRTSMCTLRTIHLPNLQLFTPTCAFDQSNSIRSVFMLFTMRARRQNSLVIPDLLTWIFVLMNALSFWKIWIFKTHARWLDYLV